MSSRQVVLFERATFLVISHSTRANYTDHHRFEKISNIIKQFKLSCTYVPSPLSLCPHKPRFCELSARYAEPVDAPGPRPVYQTCTCVGVSVSRSPPLTLTPAVFCSTGPRAPQEIALAVPERGGAQQQLRGVHRRLHLQHLRHGHHVRQHNPYVADGWRVRMRSCSTTARAAFAWLPVISQRACVVLVITLKSKFQWTPASTLRQWLTSVSPSLMPFCSVCRDAGQHPQRKNALRAAGRRQGGAEQIGWAHSLVRAAGGGLWCARRRHEHGALIAMAESCAVCAKRRLTNEDQNSNA